MAALAQNSEMESLEKRRTARGAGGRLFYKDFHWFAWEYVIAGNASRSEMAHYLYMSRRADILSKQVQKTC